MKYLFRSFNALYVGGFFSVLRVTTENGRLYVSLEGPSSDIEGFRNMSVSVSYNGVTKTLANSGEKEKTANFTYSDAVKTLSFPNTALRYHDDNTVTSFTWQGGVNDPDPDVSLLIDGIRAQKQVVFNYSLANAGTGLILRAPELEDYCRSPSSDAWTHATIVDPTGYFSFPLRLVNQGRYPADWQVYFRMLFCFYRSSSDGREEYVGLTEAYSDIYTVTAQNTPYPPRNLAVRQATAGGYASVGWVAPDDPDFTVTAFELQRSVNGGSYTLRYADRSTAFNDPLDLNTQTVRYRVRSVAGSVKSSWAEMREDFEPSHSNLFLKTPEGLKGVTGLYVGIGGRPVRAEAAMQVGQN